MLLWGCFFFHRQVLPTMIIWNWFLRGPCRTATYQSCKLFQIAIRASSFIFVCLSTATKNMATSPTKRSRYLLMRGLVVPRSRHEPKYQNDLQPTWRQHMHFDGNLECVLRVSSSQKIYSMFIGTMEFSYRFSGDNSACSNNFIWDSYGFIFFCPNREISNITQFCFCITNVNTYKPRATREGGKSFASVDDPRWSTTVEMG